MAIITPELSRELIDSITLPGLQRRTRGPLEDRPPPKLEDNQAQVLVAGSGLIVAADDVPAQTREDLINCTLFAQLAASSEVPDAKKIMPWYDAYFRYLTILGWAQSDRQFQDYRFSGQHVEAHKAIEKVLVALLGPQAAALMVVEAALQALQEIEENSPWLTLFDHQSKIEKAARFQVATAQPDANGLLQTALVAFNLEAKSNFTQVLFFRFSSSSTNLKYAAGKATIYEAALAGQRAEIARRLADYRRTMVGEVKFPPLAATIARARRGPTRSVKFKPVSAIRGL